MPLATSSARDICAERFEKADPAENEKNKRLALLTHKR